MWDGFTRMSVRFHYHYRKDYNSCADEIEAPRQVLHHNLIFLAVGPGPYGMTSGSGPGLWSAC